MPARRTVLRWLEGNEDFRRQYARAREFQAWLIADELLEIADDGRNDFIEREGKDGSTATVVDHEHIQRSRLRFDARRWLLSKMLPKVYGERVLTELSGKDGGPIEFDRIAGAPHPGVERVRRLLFVFRQAQKAGYAAEIDDDADHS
jgi:hypothetical protein